jgi:DMSO reductase anchor subunit
MVINDFSLVVFTTLAQLAVGLTVMAALQPQTAGEGSGNNLRVEWMTAGLILVAAMVASLFHLGHPADSPRAITHLSTSWLSRELLSFICFGGVLVLTFLMLVKNKNGKSLLIRLTAVVGVAALLVSGMVYAPPSLPALNNSVPALFFLLTAFILGPAFGAYFVAADRQGLLLKVLTVSLIVGLVVNLALPSIWLSGGTVSRMTGANFYGSWLYWLRMVGEFVVPLAVLGAWKKIPVWLPILLLLGEGAGRIMFLSSVVSSAANIGGLN